MLTTHIAAAGAVDTDGCMSNFSASHADTAAAFLEGLQSTSVDLDDAVRRNKAQEAGAINNNGAAAQLRYLFHGSDLNSASEEISRLALSRGVDPHLARLRLG